MTDFAHARRTMVDCQIRPNDVTEGRVIDAFLAVPREDFLPADRKALAYADIDIPLGKTSAPRHLIPPMILAKMAQAATILHTDAILDVGAGTGYSSAVLSHLGAKVVALECDDDIAADAKTALAPYGNVSVATGPLERGAAASGPYDVIILEGSVEEIPPDLFHSLREGGRLLAVVGRGRSGRATIFVRVGEDFSGRVAFDAALPPLPGFERKPVFTF
ncbi:protein-L-isoaspartate O-methyltransferase family protein [Labrys monachus]|uniref:Protein-L-isoaspartate O-methyltransferase n=1 Tax=Labrys monachus TaxID=217067 RepID=A0ABU0FE63_9HYPH|nr:protein-L-isoaspartate O-methyltransferase [Labrys monachus]MDQ0392899.1 protein-L-isoaspartate(D-aspartate) O-methyltransferase [Labrys monachus]